MDTLKNMKTHIVTNYIKVASNNSYPAQIAKVLIAILIVLVIIKIGKKVLNTYQSWKESKPWILKGTKSAKKRMIILQDPSKSSAVNIKRSENEEGGLEFSYVFWMFIDDWSYKYGQWKHVLHKGNESSWPLRCPGIWLHPKENILRVYVNSYKDIGEYIDVPNIPINKWFNVAVCVQQKNVDIYFNGNLAKRKEIESLPKQNFGDLYINAFQGFSGFMSNIRYYNYYLSYSELAKHLNYGPSRMSCIDSNDMPPYLTPNWWTDN